MPVNTQRQKWEIMTEKEQESNNVWERWDFLHTACIEARSGSVWVKVVNVTLMSATLAQAGSVSCQCVMSPNEGELPVPLCPGLSPLMSFWINQCWSPPSPGPFSFPFRFTPPPQPLYTLTRHLALSPHPIMSPQEHLIAPSHILCLLTVFVCETVWLSHVWRLWYLNLFMFDC